MNDSSKPAGPRPTLSLSAKATRPAEKTSGSRASASRGGRKGPSGGAGGRFSGNGGGAEPGNRPRSTVWQAGVERPARTDRFESPARPERNDRPVRDDRPRGDRNDRFERSDRPARPAGGAGQGNRPWSGDRPARDDRPRGDRNDRFERNDRFDRSDRPARPAGAGGAGQGNRPWSADRPARDDRPRGDRNDRFERNDRFDRSDRPARPAGAGGAGQGNRPWSGDRPRGDRNDRFERNDRPARPAGAGGAGQGNRPWSADRPARDDRPRGDRNDRFERNDRSDRPARPAGAGFGASKPTSFGKTQGRFAPKPNANVYRADEAAQKKPLPTRISAPAAERTDLPMDGIRLNKRMAELGLCSRREADDWAENGWVLVNGQVAEMGQRVQVQDVITIDRKAAVQKEKQVTILLHKPIGYVSGQAEDGHEPAVVLITAENQWVEDNSSHRFSPAQWSGLAPAGRLDIDSTGLLVLTQNGIVARQIIGEQSELEKEYLVRVEYATDAGTVTEDVQAAFPAEQLELLRNGLSLDGKELLPAKVDWQNPEQLRFVLKEGKKRQIRRMCEQVGLRVVGLKRIRIGGVLLGNLPKGQWRYLAENERFE